MTNDKLTQRQENFVLNLFRGMPQREAYIAAGYSAKAKTSVLDVKASELAADGKIAVRLQELREEAKSVAVMDIVEKREFYAQVKRNEEEETITRLRATDYDSKLAKHYDIPINYQDNRTINFIVKNQEELEGVQQILAGVRPKQIVEGGEQ